MRLKKCSRCGEEKVELAFGVLKSAKDGLRPHCRECASKEAHSIHAKNKAAKEDRWAKFFESPKGGRN